MSTLLAPGVRQELTSRLLEARHETEKLFSILDPAALYDRPIPERHRIAFYIGHLEAFDWNLFQAQLGLKSFQPEFDHLFAFGIDPVDGGLPTDVPADWPTMDRIERYRSDIRSRLDSALQAGEVDENLLNIAIEHRLMHAETLEYMFHQLPVDRKMRPANDPVFQTAPLTPGLIQIPEGSATLGLSRQSKLFGWDNEFEQHEVDVRAFAIDKYKVTNGDFLRFLEAGGYTDSSFWTPADWSWINEAGVSHPVFWVPAGGSWKYRTMFDEIALPLDWPVYVSHAEASAYASWQGKVLPSEAEWQRAAAGAQAPGIGRQSWNPPPVGASPHLQSTAGLEDLLGTGWEWTSTPFAPFQGFEIMPDYPGYSANFFDGKHYLMKGGSTRTAACMLRPTFRNWFQPHYQYVYAGFRCAAR